MLSFRQRSLDPQCPMCDYDFSDNNLVHLTVKRLGGGPTDDGNFMIITNNINCMIAMIMFFLII